MSSHPYIGRFAPSPSGPLHAGSLLCALASYLDAKANDGKWLLRIEDIDPPREQPEATDSILRTLDAHGLTWDGEVTFQSSRTEAYLEALQKLDTDGLSYPCCCTRKRLATLNGVYDQHCLYHPVAPQVPTAIRFKLSAMTGQQGGRLALSDRIQGIIPTEAGSTSDFIIRRKDRLFAYQLAVVVDDIWQNISHIVRGSDLLSSTLQQASLQKALGGRQADYAHIPVLVDKSKAKLSKQSHAAATNDLQAQQNIVMAMHYLGQKPHPSLEHEKLESILEWGIAHWNIKAVPNCSTLLYTMPHTPR